MPDVDTTTEAIEAIRRAAEKAKTLDDHLAVANAWIHLALIPQPR